MSDQTTIFGDQLNDVLAAETTGRTIRPWKRLIDPVAAEFRLHATDDGLQVRAVDSANVFAVETTLPASAFESYAVESETVFGVSKQGLGSLLQHARYGTSTDDAVTLTGDPTTLRSRTDRDYAGVDATVREQRSTIEPDSIRDGFDAPEFSFETSVDLDPQAFIDIIKAVSTGEYITLHAESDGIRFVQTGDIESREVAVDADIESACGPTLFSVEYLNGLASGLSNSYAESLTLKWGEDYPLAAEFECPSGAHGRYILSPRISAD